MHNKGIVFILAFIMLTSGIIPAEALGFWESLAVGVATFVAAPVVVPAALGAAGFTTAGVAAGSLAAATQSAVYGGATAGVFSALQSAGATAAISTGTKLAIGAGGAAIAGGVWAGKSR